MMDNFILWGLLFFCGYWLGCKHSEIAYRKWADLMVKRAEEVEEAAGRMLKAKDVTPR